MKNEKCLQLQQEMRSFNCSQSSTWPHQPRNSTQTFIRYKYKARVDMTNEQASANTKATTFIG